MLFTLLFVHVLLFTLLFAGVACCVGVVGLRGDVVGVDGLAAEGD